MLWLTIALALAVAPQDADEIEEIVVYDNPFAQWDETRWWVASEQIIPTGVWLGTRTDRLFFSTAWQIEAIVACRLTDREGRRRRDVRCRVEESAIRAATVDQWQRPSDRVWVDTVLGELRDGLSGVEIWLRASASGRVLKVDVEQLDDFAPGVFEHVASQVFNPFNIEIPARGLVHREAWMNYRDPLLQLPQTLATRSHTQAAHHPYKLDDRWVVQSIGASSVAIIYETQAMEEEELFCRLAMNSVAVYGADDQILAERAWNVTGKDIPYWHAGRLRRLGPDERVELGTTEQISPRGRTLPNVATWEPVDPELLR